MARCNARLASAARRATRVSVLSRIAKRARRLLRTSVLFAAVFGADAASLPPTARNKLRTLAVRALASPSCSLLSGPKRPRLSIALLSTLSGDPCIARPLAVLQQWMQLWTHHPPTSANICACLASHIGPPS